MNTPRHDLADARQTMPSDGGVVGSPGSPDARWEVRRALRTCLSDIPPKSLVLVACSGGPDSLALAAAAGEEQGCARALPLRFGAAIVDHGLQEGSDAVAEHAGEACRGFGLDPVIVLRVRPAAGPGAGGPEAAARDARRAILSETAAQQGAHVVLLAHTRDDQAETVLLRLARGSGARSLSGMPTADGIWRRPLLDMPREIVRASLGATPAWSDPHNLDPRFTRSRVRADVIPALVRSLGPAAVESLARSARLLRDDADALDEWAEARWVEMVCEPTVGQLRLEVEALAALPRAVRTRILRRACLACGSPATDLTFEHVTRVEALVSDWHGQGALDLPGLVSVHRECGSLYFSPDRGSARGH